MKQNISAKLRGMANFGASASALLLVILPLLMGAVNKEIPFMEIAVAMVILGSMVYFFEKLLKKLD